MLVRLFKRGFLRLYHHHDHGLHSIERILWAPLIYGLDCTPTTRPCSAYAADGSPACMTPQPEELTVRFLADCSQACRLCIWTVTCSRLFRPSLRILASTPLSGFDRCTCGASVRALKTPRSPHPPLRPTTTELDAHNSNCSKNRHLKSEIESSNAPMV